MFISRKKEVSIKQVTIMLIIIITIIIIIVITIIIIIKSYMNSYCAHFQSSTALFSKA